MSLTEQINTTTPGGKLIFHVMGVLAQFERDLIRERTNAGLAAARVRLHLTLAAAVYVGGIVLSVFFPILYDLASPTGAPYQLVLTAIAIFLLFSFPLSLGVAVLRYRLWEIDVLINRTLVYGTLTVLVVGAYVLVVTSISTLFHTSRNIFIELFATSLVAFLGSPAILIPLANPSQWLAYGSHKKQAEADLMDEQLSSFFPLHFTLNRMSLREN